VLIWLGVQKKHVFGLGLVAIIGSIMILWRVLFAINAMNSPSLPFIILLAIRFLTPVGFGYFFFISVPSFTHSITHFINFIVTLLYGIILFTNEILLIDLTNNGTQFSDFLFIFSGIMLVMAIFYYLSSKIGGNDEK
jgi:hypothetical protein